MKVPVSPGDVKVWVQWILLIIVYGKKLVVAFIDLYHSIEQAWIGRNKKAQFFNDAVKDLIRQKRGREPTTFEMNRVREMVWRIVPENKGKKPKKLTRKARG